MKIMGIDIGTTTISVVLTEDHTEGLLARETAEHCSFLRSEIPEQKIQDLSGFIRSWKHLLRK